MLNENNDGPILRIEVEDTGPGLSLEQQKKLFQESIQFNAAEMQAGNGSGFGLYSKS
jgi:signal transduction histidine kinase